jgi:hypothetical protein
MSSSLATRGWCLTCVKFYSLYSCIFVHYDLFHIQLSLRQTYGSTECMYVCMYVCMSVPLHTAKNDKYNVAMLHDKLQPPMHLKTRTPGTRHHPSTIIIFKACCRPAVGRWWHVFLIPQNYPHVITFSLIGWRSHFRNKEKVNLFPSTQWDHMGKWRYTPLIFNLCTRCSFTPQPLYPLGKRPWYPLNRRMGVFQHHSGCFGKREKSLATATNQTTIPWLSCP